MKALCLLVLVVATACAMEAAQKAPSAQEVLKTAPPERLAAALAEIDAQVNAVMHLDAHDEAHERAALHADPKEGAKEGGDKKADKEGDKKEKAVCHWHLIDLLFSCVSSFTVPFQPPLQ